MTTVNVWEVDSCADSEEKQIPFATMKEELQITVANQTLFVLEDVSYTPGASNLAVFLNGVRQSVEAGDYVELSRVSVRFTTPLKVGQRVLFVVNDYTTSVPDLSRTLLEVKGAVTDAGSAFEALSVHSLAELRTIDGVSGYPKAIVWGDAALGAGSVKFYYFDANSQALELPPAVIKPTRLAVGRWILMSGTGDTLQAADNLLCPGFTWVRASDTSITAAPAYAGFDLTKLFKPGKRVQLVEGVLGAEPVVKHGVVLTAVHSGPTAVDTTTLTLTMEGGDLILADPQSVCLTSSDSAWAPVADSPFLTGVGTEDGQVVFDGSAILDIAVGDIGGQPVFVIVGADGHIGVSFDEGVTWELAQIPYLVEAGTPGSVTFHSVTYNSDAKVFLVAGVNSAAGGVILRTIDCITWTEPGGYTDYIGLGSGQAKVIYFEGTGKYLLSVNDSGSNQRTVYATDGDTMVWLTADPNIVISSFYGKATVAKSVGAVIGVLLASSDDVAEAATPEDTTLSSKYINVGGQVAGLHYFYHAPSNRDVVAVTTTNGIVKLYNTASGVVTDTTTFAGIGIYDVTYSALLNMLIVVGEQGTIGYLHMPNSASTAITDGSFTVTQNGFSPSDTITCVARDDTANIFIAGSEGGVICRSTNGVS